MWYKNYYSNFQYSNTFKKVFTFENLLNIFFKYGLLYKSNLYFHNFWYKNQNLLNIKNHLNNLNLNSFSLYFRKFHYSHTTLTIEHSYFLRNKTPEFFPLRLYIMKYNNWLLASIQWFKPLKSKKVGKASILNFGNSSNTSIIYKRDFSTKNKTNRRTRLIMFWFRNSLYNLNNHKYYF
jgi:hypothetical protein